MKTIFSNMLKFARHGLVLKWGKRGTFNIQHSTFNIEGNAAEQGVRRSAFGVQGSRFFIFQPVWS
jgi:hypothetical protein